MSKIRKVAEKTCSAYREKLNIFQFLKSQNILIVDVIIWIESDRMIVLCNNLKKANCREIANTKCKKAD